MHNPEYDDILSSKSSKNIYKDPDFQNYIEAVAMAILKGETSIESEHEMLVQNCSMFDADPEQMESVLKELKNAFLDAISSQSLYSRKYVSGLCAKFNVSDGFIEDVDGLIEKASEDNKQKAEVERKRKEQLEQQRRAEEAEKKRKAYEERKEQQELERKESAPCNNKGKYRLIWMLIGFFAAVIIVIGIKQLSNPQFDNNIEHDKSPVAVTNETNKPETRPKSAIVPLRSISFSKTSMTLEEGQSTSIDVRYSPSNASFKSTVWKSSDASVVNVSYSGEITAVREGNATIIASCGDLDCYCNVTVTGMLSQMINGHEYVDLGLSVKWATCNVGATKPEEYGNYYAWGETTTKGSYDWGNYKYRVSGDSYKNVTFSKYVAESKYGSVDNQVTLSLSDDAARQNWGGSWRMPTEAEMEELENNCDYEWTSRNGVKGALFTSRKNGKSIFLPAACYYDGSSRNYEGSYGYYWSSSLYLSYSNFAWTLRFYSGGTLLYSNDRCYGLSVRPVSE